MEENDMYYCFNQITAKYHPNLAKSRLEFMNGNIDTAHELCKEALDMLNKGKCLKSKTPERNELIK